GGGPGRGPGPDYGNLGPGALVVGFDQDGNRAGAIQGYDDDMRLSDEQVEKILALDEDARTLSVAGYGSFRIRSVGSGDDRGIVGLPSADVDDSVGQLATVAAVLALGGIVCAGLVGLVVVRRQLRPL